MTAQTPSLSNHAVLMDRIYRYQCWLYDLTRKYYLLGRDRLIRELEVRPGDHVLEIGCGTARNLIALARRHPDAVFYGLDASQEMLLTAEKKVVRAGLQDRIILRQGLAEELDPQQTFGHSCPFDAIFFSYSLSMIPPWKESLHAAMAHLKPGGQLAVVDFCDQGDLPVWFQWMLQTWLAWFHVHHEPALLPFLQTLPDSQDDLRIDFLYGRYSYFARLTQSR